jgi:hypothetical protein
MVEVYVPKQLVEELKKTQLRIETQDNAALSERCSVVARAHITLVDQRRYALILRPHKRGVRAIARPVSGMLH